MTRFLLSIACTFLFLLPQLVMSQGVDAYRPGIVILKVKGEHRSQCKDNTIEVLELKSLFEQLGYHKVFKKYAWAEPPTREYNDQGYKLADISLIYELVLDETADVGDAVKKIEETGLVEYSEPDYVSYSMYTPNDAGIASVMPYHFDNVMAYAAWDSTQGDTNTIIGITETSMDVNHEDLRDNIKYNYADPINGNDDDNDGKVDNYAGWDMVDDDNTLFINNEIHGTAVAAISSATVDNGIGYGGLGFKCKFIPVKAGNNSQVITHGYPAIGYCVQMGAKVVNCSWGNTTFSQQAQDIVTYTVVNSDVVLVASAGNASATDYYYPASYQYALSVTGVDANDLFDNGVNATFTYNDSVDVSAPGFSVYTTATYGGQYLYSPPQGGTSMAAPIVSGIAGLVRSKFPCLTATEVVEHIKASADNIDTITENVPYAGKIGTGRVNALNAVTGDLCMTVGKQEVASKQPKLSLYPNPTSNILNIKLESYQKGNTNMRLFNTLGQEVWSSQVILNGGNRLITIDLSPFAEGTYVLRLENGDIGVSEILSVSR